MIDVLGGCLFKGLIVFNISRMILLGLVIFQGSTVVAMEKRVDSPRTPRSNPLSCSAEARRDGEIIKRTAALKISVEMRKEEKISQSKTYYDYCGGRGISPQDLSPGLSYEYALGYYRSDCP